MWKKNNNPNDLAFLSTSLILVSFCDHEDRRLLPSFISLQPRPQAPPSTRTEGRRTAQNNEKAAPHYL